MPAGAKPGEKRGGRKKGVPNKATIARQAAVAASGITPLEYMLALMRDTSVSQQRRDWAANASAPYVHPKLASMDVKHGGAVAHRHSVSDGELEHIAIRGSDGAAKAPQITH